MRTNTPPFQLRLMAVQSCVLFSIQFLIRNQGTPHVVLGQADRYPFKKPVIREMNVLSCRILQYTQIYIRSNF